MEGRLRWCPRIVQVTMSYWDTIWTTKYPTRMWRIHAPMHPSKTQGYLWYDIRPLLIHVAQPSQSCDKKLESINMRKQIQS